MANSAAFLAPFLAQLGGAWDAMAEETHAVLACDAHAQLYFANAAALAALEVDGEALGGERWAVLLFGEHGAALVRGWAGLRGLLEIPVEVGARRWLASVGAIAFFGSGRHGRSDVPGVMLVLSDEACARVARRELAARDDAGGEWRAAMAAAERGGRAVFVAEAESPHPIELTLERRDGGMVAEGRCVAARRLIEEVQRRTAEQLTFDRLKSQLVANVSHELRTPLVSIKGYADLMLRGALGPLTQRQQRGLEIASGNTDRLIELIETLLDFTRIEDDRLELHLDELDLREVVRAALDGVAERVAARNMVLTVELGQEPLLVNGDAARLGQVLRALVANAEKFSEGRGGARISIGAELSHDEVRVWVRDQGIGIPRAAQQQIYERFFQVDASTTRRFGGAGLGLAMAKEIVQLHGGHIALESQVDSGSTFTVVLPRARRESSQTSRPVVLVGASAARVEALRSTLSSLMPMDLFFAGNETELLRRARRHRPDLVVCGFDEGAAALVLELKRDPETAALPVVVVVDDAAAGAVARADLVVPLGDAARLRGGVAQILGAGRALTEREVVVVEDEIEILDFTRFLLEREGYRVVGCQSGEEALTRVTGDTALVILDVALDGADGIEVCRELKRSPSRGAVPVLIMTAMSGAEVRTLSLAAGADGYLVKPFSVDDFLRQVRLHTRRE